MSAGGSRCVLLDLAAATGAGQETRAREFARLVRRFDPDSRFVVVRQQGRLKSIDWRALGATVIDTPAFRGRWAGVQRMAWQTLNTASIIARERVDAYVTYSHFLPPGVRCAVRVVGVSNLAPFSAAAWRVSSASERLRLSLLRRSILASAKRATVVLALSHECRRLLIAGGVSPDVIRVASNGADWNEPAAGSSAHAGAFVLCVSHFYAYKNFETLIDAFAALEPRLRQSFELRIVGPPVDRRYYERIGARAARTGAPIRLVPGVPRSELAALYQSCSVFVFPSLIENSPNVLLEAMAHGSPCLVSSAAPMPEFGGDAVRYFEPCDVAGLSAALASMLDDPAACRELGERARVRAGEFQWDALVRATVDAYRGYRGAGVP